MPALVAQLTYLGRIAFGIRNSWCFFLRISFALFCQLSTHSSRTCDFICFCGFAAYVSSGCYFLDSRPSFFLPFVSSVVGCLLHCLIPLINILYIIYIYIVNGKIVKYIEGHLPSAQVRQSWRQWIPNHWAAAQDLKCQRKGRQRPGFIPCCGTPRFWISWYPFVVEEKTYCEYIVPFKPNPFWNHMVLHQPPGTIISNFSSEWFCHVHHLHSLIQSLNFMSHVH